MNRSPTDAEKIVAAALLERIDGNQRIFGCPYALAQVAIRALRELPDDAREVLETTNSWGATIDRASPPEPI